MALKLQCCCGPKPGYRQSRSIVIGMEAGAITTTIKERDEKFADHEKLKILAACVLHKGEWNQVTPIYEDKVTEERRTRLGGTEALVYNYGHGVPFLNVLVDPASVGYERTTVWLAEVLVPSGNSIDLWFLTLMVLFIIQLQPLDMLLQH